MRIPILVVAWLIVNCAGFNGLSVEAASVSTGEVQAVAEIAFTEGPTVDADGNVYFTDMRSRRILKFVPGKGVSTYRNNGSFANGLIFDHQWRLIACEGGRVTRTDIKTGEIEVLAEGERIKRPNDVTIDSKGRIYFTDPGDKSIYRIDPDGTVARILTASVLGTPNGIVISPDDNTLYYVDTNTPEKGERLIRAFDLAEDGTVSNMRVLYNFVSGRGADGISIDVEGNVYAAAGTNRNRENEETDGTKTGIYVISPEGNLLKYYPVYEDRITNCAFGGPDMKTLYVTAGKTLFSIQVEVEGTRR
jgi:gluconolactonase